MNKMIVVTSIAVIITVCAIGVIYFLIIGLSSGPVILPPFVDAGNDQTILVNKSVTFNGIGTDNKNHIILYEWDFDGDGLYDWQSIINGSTTHTYTIPGNYTAKFRVTNYEIVSCVDSCIIEVNPHVVNLTILNHRSFVDPQNVFDIVGEVQNTGTLNLKNVEITAIFYDIDNNVVGYPHSSSLIDIIKPGQKSPFMVARFEGADHYILETTFSETDEEPYDDFTTLNVTADYISIWGLEIYQINGEIKNVGNQIANSIEIVVTFYDSTNTVIGSGKSTIVNPSNLNPGEIGNFTFNIGPDYLAGTIDNYALQIQCS